FFESSLQATLVQYSCRFCKLGTDASKLAPADGSPVSPTQMAIFSFPFCARAASVVFCSALKNVPDKSLAAPSQYGNELCVTKSQACMTGALGAATQAVQVSVWVTCIPVPASSFLARLIWSTMDWTGTSAR